LLQNYEKNFIYNKKGVIKFVILHKFMYLCAQMILK
jgi:hypothetical protein